MKPLFPAVKPRVTIHDVEGLAAALAGGNPIFVLASGYEMGHFESTDSDTTISIVSPAGKAATVNISAGNDGYNYLSSYGPTYGYSLGSDNGDGGVTSLYMEKSAGGKRKAWSVDNTTLNMTIQSLAGTGNRMVVASATGVLSTQAIPSGGGSGGLTGFGVTVAKSANFTAVTNTRYSVDTTGGNVTATLPSTASKGDRIFAQKSDSTANQLIYSGKINGVAATTLIIRTSLQGKELEFDGVDSWNVTSGDLSLPALDGRYLQLANNLSDLASASTARTNLGLTALATTTPAAGVATFLATPSSANWAAALTDKTGTGVNVFATSPTLVTPNLGTPSALTLTNATGLPVAGISATGTPSSTTYLRGDGTWATVSGGFTNPMTTAGDMIYGGTGGAGTRLAAGTSSQLLLGGTTPTWTTLNTVAVDLTSTQTVGGAKTFSSTITTADVQINASGTTTTSPRNFGFTGTNAAGSLQFGDTLTGINYGRGTQNARFAISSYNTLELVGANLAGGDFGSGIPFRTGTVRGYGLTDVGVLIYNPSNGGPVPLAIQRYAAAASATQDLLRIVNESAAILASVNNLGYLGIGSTTPAKPLHVSAGDVLFGANGTTSGDLIYHANGSSSYLGIYDASASLVYGISRSLPSPTGTSTLGGYYNGLGIGGSTSSGGNPIFGVLNSAQSGQGLGNASFTVLDSKAIYTFNNTLDDGSGNMTVAGNLTLADAKNIVLNTTTGTKIGTATSQKLGFYNATPVVQQSATADLGTVLSTLGLRAAGTAYTLTSSGAMSLTGAVTLGTPTSTNLHTFSAGQKVFRRAIADAAATVAATDYIIAYTSLTATRAVTLPTASTVTNQVFIIKDETGNAGTSAITITGTVDGSTSKSINTAYGVMRLYSNGTAYFTF